MICVLHHDLNATAAIKVNRSAQLLVSLHQQRITVGRSNNSLSRTAANDPGRCSRPLIRSLEVPIHPIERNHHRLPSPKTRTGSIFTARSDDLLARLSQRQQNDSRIPVIARRCWLPASFCSSPSSHTPPYKRLTHHSPTKTPQIRHHHDHRKSKSQAQREHRPRTP